MLTVETPDHSNGSFSTWITTDESQPKETGNTAMQNVKSVKRYAAVFAMSALAAGAVITGLSAANHLNSPVTDVAAPVATPKPAATGSPGPVATPKPAATGTPGPVATPKSAAPDGLPG
jgi:hypothetical protein